MDSFRSGVVSNHRLVFLIATIGLAATVSIVVVDVTFAAALGVAGFACLLYVADFARDIAADSNRLASPQDDGAERRRQRASLFARDAPRGSTLVCISSGALLALSLILAISGSGSKDRLLIGVEKVRVSKSAAPALTFRLICAERCPELEVSLGETNKRGDRVLSRSSIGRGEAGRVQLPLSERVAKRLKHLVSRSPSSIRLTVTGGNEQPDISVPVPFDGGR